ncbi:MAG: hypothetical protein AAFV88_15405 [Planctomycetota bacterium]
MSLPDELLHELLSAHLDDALSGDERARVETLLSESETARNRFADLQRDRLEIRQALTLSATAPPDFAVRVMDSIAEKAPQPVAQTASRRSPILWVVGIAASLLFVGWLIRSQEIGPQPDGLLAGNDGVPVENSDPLTSDVEPETEPARATDQMVAAELVDEPLPAELDKETAGEGQPKVESVAMSPDTADVSAPEKPRRPVERIIAEPTQMLMVVRVKRTELGRQRDSFTEALASAGIEIGEERPVSEELVLSVAPNTGDGGEVLNEYRPEVMLLESPIKKLDVLISKLVSDSEGVESVGISLVASNDAALLSVYDAIRADDPTEVQHDGRGTPVTGESRAFKAWAEKLSDRAFMPSNSGMGVPSLSAAKPGNNPMSNLLILVD